jgi:hypothetical protein
LAYAKAQNFSLGVHVADSKNANASATIDLTIDLADQLPTLTGANGALTVNDNKTIAPFSRVRIGEVVANQPLTVTVTLSDSSHGSLSLASVPTGTTFSAGTGNAAGTYTITGDAAAVTVALARVVFTPKQNLAAVGQPTDTVFTVKVDDRLGTANSSVTNGTTQVVSTSVNDAPILSGALANQALSDETTIMPFAQMTVVDADPGANGATSQAENMTVTLSRAANGNLSLGNATLASAVAFSGANGVYAFHGNTAQVTLALDELIFTPTSHEVAPGKTESTTFTVGVSDGVVARPVTNNKTTVIATAVNDLPTVSVGNANLAVNDNGTIKPLSPASGNITISDHDFGITDTLTITLGNASLGTLSGGGVRQTGNGTGIYTVSGSMAVLAADLANITFTPKPNLTPPGTIVNEAIGFTVAQGALTTSASRISVAITSINDAPTISGTTTTAIRINDNVSTNPFRSTVKIADADVGQSETATITLNHAENGTLSLAAGPAGVSFSAGTGNAAGTYTLTGGNATAVTTALQDLVFTPTSHQVAPGSSVTMTFTIAVTDSGNLDASNALSASDSKTTVVVRALDDGPTGLNATIMPGLMGPVAINSAVVSLAAVDADFDETFTYSISGGGQRADFVIGGTNHSQLLAKTSLAAGTYQVTVAARDASGKTFSRTLNIVIGASSSFVS